MPSIFVAWYRTGRWNIRQIDGWKAVMRQLAAAGFRWRLMRAARSGRKRIICGVGMVAATAAADAVVEAVQHLASESNGQDRGRDWGWRVGVGLATAGGYLVGRRTGAVAGGSLWLAGRLAGVMRSELVQQGTSWTTWLNCRLQGPRSSGWARGNPRHATDFAASDHRHSRAPGVDAAAAQDAAE